VPSLRQLANTDISVCLLLSSLPGLFLSSINHFSSPRINLSIFVSGSSFSHSALPAQYSQHGQRIRRRDYQGFVLRPSLSHQLTATALTDASEREITHHYTSQEFRTVIFTVKYSSSTGHKTTAIPEKQLQGIDEPLVLEYWTQKGGRATTGLGKDGILKIVDETKRYWIVQWVGYPADEDGMTCETKDVVAQKCPVAIVKWRSSLSREQVSWMIEPVQRPSQCWRTQANLSSCIWFSTSAWVLAAWEESRVGLLSYPRSTKMTSLKRRRRVWESFRWTV
jgi:hypothetical protein